MIFYTTHITQATASFDDALEDARQLEAFRSNPPHFLTVSAKG